MTDQFGKFAPGTFWATPDGLTVLVRDDGRFLAYPSMRLLVLRPDLSTLAPGGPS